MRPGPLQRLLRLGAAAGVACVAVGVAIPAAPAAAQTATYQFTGSLQTYTVPAGASGVVIQAAGAGGGGGGADENGPGADGGTGALVSAVYLAPAGTVINVYVGGGGALGYTSNFGHTCTTSAGAGGASGGLGYAGGTGGAAGCSGWSGSGGGGGAATLVATAANSVLLVAGGGGGGQGGSWNSSSVPSLSSTLIGTLPGGSGGTGAFPGQNADGGGGGGGGAGCPAGAGGTTHADNSGTAYGTAAGAGGSCANTTLVSAFTWLGALGGAGGAGDPADGGNGPDPGGVSGAAGSVVMTPVFAVTGTVYADTNHNAALDVGEGGTGIASLYVKLAASVSGVCQTPATAAAAVSAASGAYSLPSVVPGTYCLTLTNSAALANTTPYTPAGWVATEAPTGVRTVTVTAVATAAQNFGLYHGSSLSLVVFADTGTGGGVANDGAQNGAEPGIANVPVTASVGGSPIASAVTGGAGAAVVWLPAATSGTVTIAPSAPSGDLATGGSPGNSGGSFVRPKLTFTYAPGVSYTGVSFGLIPPNAFAPNGALAAQPGTTVFYSQQFTAGSAIQVSFATSATASPAVPGWAETIYLDAACSGQYAAGDTVLGGAITLAAQQKLCLLVKEFVPAGAPANAANTVSLTASFSYVGSAAPAPATAVVVDTTTVTGPGTIALVKQVANLTQGSGYGASNNALPGNTLQYQITLTNQGSVPVSNVTVNDATPAYTGFVSAACPSTSGLPANFSACAVTTHPAAGAQGALAWSFTGTLAPGAQAAVSYQVQVAQ
jgi:uncharacterized repeat protein (TIGR01451 family)